METNSRLELANDNAAEFWSAQARARGWERLHRPGLTAVHCAPGATDPHRLIVTRPYGEPAPLEEELADLLRSWGTTQLCLEDPYTRLDLSRFGCIHGLDMAVMVREPGPVERAPRVGRPGAPGQGRPIADLTIREVPYGDADGLADVERTVVEGFPVKAEQPWVRGGMLPVSLLAEPGLRAWLAQSGGANAGACLTHDDGRAVGVYWVATLPEHRSKGVARAVLETALAAHPGRSATLVSTLLAEPLYRKLGFVEQGVTRWWGYPAVPEAR